MAVQQTLIDIQKMNGADPITGMVDETMRLHPEMTLIAARTIKGTRFKTLVRTALGNTAGSFRPANAGSANVKHTYENRSFETMILTPRFESDVAVADSHEDGAAAFIAVNASGTLEGEWQAMCRQFYYGPNSGLANSSGPPGLIDMYDATNMVVDAAGTTATTGSSVWFVITNEKAVQWLWGNNQGLKFGAVRVEAIVDPNDSTKRYDAYVQTGTGYPGLKFADLRAAVRIKNITADAGKMLTDALMSKAVAKFPAGLQPDVCLMTRRSIQQLQASRTATNPTGAQAPFPTEIEGLNGTKIPIRVTESILDTEPLTL